MAARRVINLDKVPELVRRHSAGATLRELAAWLKEQGCKVSVETVRAELAKAGQAAEQRPELIIPEAEADTVPERIKALRYEIADERREARKVRSVDWKRYQGALRMTMALIQMEARPTPGSLVPGTDKPSDGENTALTPMFYVQGSGRPS